MNTILMLGLLSEDRLRRKPGRGSATMTSVSLMLGKRQQIPHLSGLIRYPRSLSDVR
jgi:hypothetical protein